MIETLFRHVHVSTASTGLWIYIKKFFNIPDYEWWYLYALFIILLLCREGIYHYLHEYVEEFIDKNSKFQNREGIYHYLHVYVEEFIDKNSKFQLLFSRIYALPFESIVKPSAYTSQQS